MARDTRRPGAFANERARHRYTPERWHARRRSAHRIRSTPLRVRPPAIAEKNPRTKTGVARRVGQPDWQSAQPGATGLRPGADAHAPRDPTRALRKPGG